MKSFDALFDSVEEIEYHGEIIRRYYKLTDEGQYNIRFTFVESNSNINQAIVIHFVDFMGDVWVENKKVDLTGNGFPVCSFWMDTAPNHFNVQINMEKNGIVYICNGSDLLGTKQICRSLRGGCAMRIEQLTENTFRMHCNDHESDDDFDDLVFDMEIEKI